MSRGSARSSSRLDLVGEAASLPRLRFALQDAREPGRLGKEGHSMDGELSLEGPVLRINGEWMLLIPLEAGGAELVECSRGVSEVQGEFLKIVIPEWLAGVLRIEEGDLVRVQESNGTLNIQPREARPVN
jgi:hypothetical protein